MSLVVNDVGYWPKCEVPTPSENVCCWGVDQTYCGNRETDAFDPKEPFIRLTNSDNGARAGIPGHNVTIADCPCQ